MTTVDLRDAGPAVATLLAELDISHVVWLPDSTLGPWEASLEKLPACRLLRVCRESEAWAIAAGLHLAGLKPLVMIQSTGLFDSGDALRNVLFDLRLPLYALIGYRSFLLTESTDTAREFAEPVLRAWGLDYLLLREAAELPRLADHYRQCRQAGQPGVCLIAEGTI